jgi:hypothetical protein
VGQNSGNSLRPSSSDLPSYQAKLLCEPKGRKRGSQIDYHDSARKLLPDEEVDYIVELKPALLLSKVIRSQP